MVLLRVHKVYSIKLNERGVIAIDISFSYGIINLR
nr:MAG TPA: hypothetical protein [Caudoviricetes sp.]